MPLSTDITHWIVNVANVEITSTCACMHWNLIWLDKTHSFTVWKGFKDQGFKSCPHNVWDHPHFHQHSSWCLIVIIHHSHQWNLCQNSLEMSSNVFQLTSPSSMPLSIDVACSAVNRANVEIPSTCASMYQNLTWLDETHAFMVWEGSKAKGCMSFPQNIWDRPCFHQCSSCSLIVIIHHSHQQNIFQNSLEMSWNVFQHAHHQCHYTLISHVENWNGSNVEIPSTCSCMCENLTWLDKTRAFMVWDGFKSQGYMSCPHNIWYHPSFHQCSSCSLIVIIHNSHQQESLLKLSWNVMESLPRIPSLMPLSIDMAHWVVNGANAKIPSTCECMCQNLTWSNKTHAFMVRGVLKGQGCMLCPHNLWYHPRFHQHSSCNLTVIIFHSHQWNLCQSSLEISWNIFQQAHHQCHYPLRSHVEQWMGPMLKFHKIVSVCIEIWHG